MMAISSLSSKDWVYLFKDRPWYGKSLWIIRNRLSSRMTNGSPGFGSSSPQIWIRGCFWRSLGRFRGRFLPGNVDGNVSLGAVTLWKSIWRTRPWSDFFVLFCFIFGYPALAWCCRCIWGWLTYFCLVDYCPILQRSLLTTNHDVSMSGGAIIPLT